jgi:hypothetical protein
LHTKNWLYTSPGSALKVPVVGGWYLAELEPSLGQADQKINYIKEVKENKIFILTNTLFLSKQE